MGRTTIAIDTATRARIKQAAEQESTTIDGLLQSLLDERERNQFWTSFEDLTPESYAAASVHDGDGVDVDYVLEDRALEAEER